MTKRSVIVMLLAVALPLLAQETPPPPTAPQFDEQREKLPPAEENQQPANLPGGEEAAPQEDQAPVPREEEAAVVTPPLPPQQEPDAPTTPTPETAPQAAPAAPTPARVPEPEENRERFPNLDLYLPEGEVDLRARKLIRNVLFESQINYKFADGDISSFLRYKYYARDFTYKLGVFDTIEFDSIDEISRDFDRVRGGLLLFEVPTRYNRRYLGLVQVDGLTFGDVDRPDNNRNNVYAKLAFQQGTTFDERLNSIAGESRGRIPSVLTAFRDIGQLDLAYAIAFTQSIESVGSDFDYSKIEGEALKRIDLTENSFLISRLHAGSFLSKHRVLPEGERPDDESFSVPRYEMFKLGGRGALKGVDDSHRGTDEIHLSNEYFVPIFRNRDYNTFSVHWNNMYGIVYAGAGNLGFTADEVFAELSDYVVDAGLGFEASATVRDFEVIVSAVYAQTVKAPDELEGDEVRVSVRTRR